MAQTLENLPAIQETWVQSLVQEDSLKNGMAIHSCIFAWRIPWTEEPGGYSPWSFKESGTTKGLTLTHSICAIKHFEKSQNNIKVTSCFKNYNKASVLERKIMHF